MPHPQRLLLPLCLLLPGIAAAQLQNLKPGLWETTMQMRLQGERGDQMAAAMAQQQKAMANMPPEQRKMIEDMIAKRGMKTGPANGGGTGMAVKTCITKEMIARAQIGHQEGQSDCTRTMLPASGNTMKFSFSCPKPPSHGEGTVTFTSPEAYSMKVNATSTIKGKEETTEMQSSAKWLSSDCGDIKPIQMPAKP